MSEEKPQQITFVSAGMDLRDYFAANALGKINMVTWNWDANKAGQTDCEHIAEAAYKIADAMLKEREKK